MIHRDIKPANILPARPEEIKVSDLERRDRSEHGSNPDPATSGLPDTYRPNRSTQRNIDAPDRHLFRLGVVMYRLLTGRSP
ncbi:MAG: serine/threonine protein kinase, partial [Nitrosomonadales bacterium]|nr:serine/threonine protein kinase [Nitrosomonadales bacterium]